MKNVAIILAAGDGSRFGSTDPKQFCKLNGKRVVDLTVEVFYRHPLIDHIIVVVPKGAVLYFESPGDWTPGGKTRHESILEGYKLLPDDTRKVLIHDAVRPFVSERTITECLEKLEEFEGVDVVCPTDDTIVEVDRDQVVTVPKRASLRRGQTPQGFLKRVLDSILTDDMAPRAFAEDFTDTVGMAVELGFSVGVVNATTENMKITHPYDLFLAEQILQYRKAELAKLDVDGQNIAVFGGSGGIGSEVVRILKEAGAKVYAPPKSEIDLCEMSWYSKFMTATRNWGGWDCVIQVAGDIRSGGTLSDWNRMSALYVDPAIQLMSDARNTMLPGGHFIFVGSSSAAKGRSEFPMYSAAKAALVNLVEGMAPQLLERGCFVTCVNPGLTDTKMADSIGGGSGKALDPAYVAKAIVSYCNTTETGQIVNVR